MTHQIRYPLARLSPAKDELVVVEFARRHVEGGDVAGIVKDVFAPMAATRENAELFEGRVTFWFSGWDEDPRELAEIPEVRAWFNKLTGEFPYWLHFIEKQGDTLFLALRLLCRGHCEKGRDMGMVGWRFADMGEFSDTVLCLLGYGTVRYVNGLYGRLGLTEEMTERVSEEVGQLLDGAME